MITEQLQVRKPNMQDPTTRFWSYVDKSAGPNACWIWKGSILKESGYGRFGLGCGKYYRAHKVSYEMVNGPVPVGLQLDHLCKNRRCVNPSHLEAVTGQINQLRSDSPTGRNARKTHCKNGHPLSGDNLDPSNLKRGWRICKTCLREIQRRSKARRKSQ